MLDLQIRDIVTGLRNIYGCMVLKELHEMKVISDDEYKEALLNLAIDIAGVGELVRKEE